MPRVLLELKRSNLLLKNLLVEISSHSKGTLTSPVWVAVLPVRE